MEELILLLIPALLAVVLIRALLMPIRFVCKAAIHSVCGFACLWLLNSISPFTGVYFPMNALTVTVAGITGLPGIACLALLAVMG